MATINSSTTHAMKTGKSKAGPPAPPPPKLTTGIKTGSGTNGKSAGTAAARRGSVPPPLKAKQLASATAIAALQGEEVETKKQWVQDLVRACTGAPGSALNLMAPHSASTSVTRRAAAADLAVAVKYLGRVFVMKDCQLLVILQQTLFPEGIQQSLLLRGSGNSGVETYSDDESASVYTGGRLKASTSAVSLTSLLSEADLAGATTTANSINTDSKRGKTNPPAAREGCLLLLRALAEIVGQPIEPFIVGAFLAAALDECASANSAVREAAEDCSIALVQLANPAACRTILSPILLQTLRNTTEWRVKTAALERVQQVCTTAPSFVQKLIPTWIPVIASQVWDTKPQVSKAAKLALTALCHTNSNSDIKPAIPAVVNAICKPSETNAAVSELMGTTFVVPVNAPTLAILCPLLARALKEKLAIHKRAACIVIANMSKLVETPEAVAPFGNLLVPELQKVAANVQFEEIRDESLKALKALTKALGDQFKAAVDQQQQQRPDQTSTNPNQITMVGASISTSTAAGVAIQELEQEQARVEAEQAKIQRERDEAAARDAALLAQEELEKQRFKEAMDAQRRLDQLSTEAVAAKKADEAQKREMARLDPKAGGKCQSCGLKKCKKTCMFFSE